jgi:hypothetical protein
MPTIRNVLSDFVKRTGAYQSQTAVGNITTGEDDLMSTTIPANTLTEVGDRVMIRAWGTTANNANTKTIKLYFGSATVVSQALTASQVGKWLIEAIVCRVSLNVQEAHALIVESIGTTLAAAKHAQEITALTATETASITVKCTGTSSASTDDIVQEGFEVLPYQVQRL